MFRTKGKGQENPFWVKPVGFISVDDAADSGDLVLVSGACGSRQAHTMG